MPSPLTEEKKDSLKRKIMLMYLKYGFDGISMDEIAARLHVGKPTLYKYFKSKEEIVREVERFAMERLTGVPLSTEGGIEDVLQGLSLLYCNGIGLAVFSGSHYMADLKNRFPDLYTEHEQAIDNLISRFQAFHEKAAEKGFCRKLSLPLVGEQFHKMLPVVIDEEYLRKHNLTLKETIREYYRMLLHQILSDDYQYVICMEETYSFCDRLTESVEEISAV
ncbi:MAG: TetR/AcrR family transcriptional regulator [Lachnospiraceae bacterium]|nr:TetR/AcrR family transcriptional regulator [Lachnospiraceae bacterium]